MLFILQQYRDRLRLVIYKFENGQFFRITCLESLKEKKKLIALRVS